MTPDMKKRADLMGDIWLPHKDTGRLMRAVGDLSDAVSIPARLIPEIRPGIGVPPVVEVYFPFNMVFDVVPVARLIGGKANVRAQVKAAKAHIFVRGRCIANTKDYAYVEFDAKAVGEMREDGVRVGIQQTMETLAAFDVVATRGSERLEAEISIARVEKEQLALIALTPELMAAGKSLPAHFPFLKKAVILTGRMSVIVPEDRKPVSRELAVAETTQNPLIRRPSQRLRIYLDEPAVAAA